VDVTDHVRNEKHLKLLNDELKHRVKNTLAMVSAIASRTLRGSAGDKALTAFNDRLAAFGKAHDVVTAAITGTASIREVVEGALAPHRSGEGRFSISGPHIMVGSKQALSLALAVHELATNAVKYGALSDDSGCVQVSWRVDQIKPMFHFSWRESGGPSIEKPTKKGFGSQLIARVLTADFGAEVETTYEPDGVICRLTAPVENLNPATPSTDQLGLRGLNDSRGSD